MTIEKLVIAGFRGATQPVDIPFAPNRMVMIYGENGTGKSTIIDAIDFVCNGQYGSLSERAGTLPKIHLPAQGVGRDGLRVDLHAGGRVWTRTLTASGPSVVGPPDPPMAMILRRSQVLQVVDAAPAERYKAIRSYIDLPGVVKSEAALRTAATDAGREYKEVVQAKGQADETLRSLWETSGSLRESQEAWATEQAEVDPDELRRIVQSEHDALGRLDMAEQAWQQSQQAKNALDLHTHAAAEAQAALAAGHREREEVDADLLEVLAPLHALLLDRPNPDVCPVCESSAATTGLTARLGVRLAALQHLCDLRTVAGKAEGERQTAEVIHHRAWAFYLEAALSLPPAATGMISEDEAAQRLAQARADRADREQRLAQMRDDLSRAGLIRALLHDWQEKTARAEELEAANLRLTSLLAVVETARKDYVDGLLRAISADVARMYVAIHPDEPVGDIQFRLDHRFSGSLTFDGRFELETNIPPQAYYSESHLDTLGICVFLALAQSRHSRARVVVLDDVLTSVDSSHLNRFLDMLEAEKPRFRQQVILTTHYRRWLNRYKQMGNTKMDIIELQTWKLQRGVRPAKALLDVDGLKNKVKAEPLDRRSVSTDAGVLLEAVLNQLTILYGCAMPRNANNTYTLQPLLDGVRKTAINLKVSRPVRGELIPFSPLLDTVKGFVAIRNQVGAHDNPAEADVLDDEVRAFGEAVVALAEALLCPECSLMPSKNKEGALHCSCGATQLTPLPSSLG